MFSPAFAREEGDDPVKPGSKPTSQHLNASTLLVSHSLLRDPAVSLSPKPSAAHFGPEPSKVLAQCQ